MDETKIDEEKIDEDLIEEAVEEVEEIGDPDETPDEGLDKVS